MLTRRTFSIVALSLSAPAFLLDAFGQEGDTVAIRIRVDDSVEGSIPPILQSTLTITRDESSEADDLIRRVPPSRAVPVIFIIVGVIAVPVVLQMIKELLRQNYYGGVIIDTRPQTINVTSDPKIPANMVFVIASDGRTTQDTSNQVSLEVLGRLLKNR
jgi:hypothetical protein